jgi:hypothetical protein
MISICRSAAAGIAAVFLVSGSAFGAAITYANQASFLAAVGTTITDNYSNPGYVRSFGPNPPNFMTDAYMSSVLNETRYIDTFIPNHNEVIGPLDGTGNPYFCTGCNGTFDLNFQTTSLTTGGGVFGVSFNYRNGVPPVSPTAPVYDFFVTFADGSTVDYTVPQTGAFLPAGFASDFWGITSTLQIRDIYFGVNGQPSLSTVFGLDNLTIAGARAVTAVPEPLTLGMFGAGLAGMAVARRRRARAS